MDKNRQVIFCRICLRINMNKRYILDDVREKTFIESIFKENGYCEELHDCICCFECRLLLYKSYKFLQKVLRAQYVLYKYLLPQEITYSSLESIDREKYDIASNFLSDVPDFVEDPAIDSETPDFASDPESEIKAELEETNNTECNDPLSEVTNTDENNLKNDMKVKVEHDSGGKEEKQFVKCIDLVAGEFTKVDPKCNENFTKTDISSDCEACEGTDNDNKAKNIANDCDGDKETLKAVEFIDPYTGELTKVDPLSLEDSVNNDFVDIFCNDVVHNDDPCPKDMTDRDQLKNDISLRDTADVVEIRHKSLNNKDDKHSICKSKDEKQVKNDKLKKARRRVATIDLISDEEVDEINRVSAAPDVANILEERFRRRNNMSYEGLDGVSEIDFTNNKKRRSRKKDEDFVPSDIDSSDVSADDSLDSFDESGRIIAWKRDTREFPMKCEECESIVISRAEHHYHYMLEHRDIEYPYKRSKKCLLCSDCGEYVSKTQLKLHQDRHSGKMWSCEYCKKKYTNRTIMLTHQRRVHNKQIGFICDYCDKTFFAKADIKLHMRTHTGERPFKCHLCEYRCAHKGNIYSHIRQFHQHMATIKKSECPKEKTGKKKRKRKAKKVYTSDSE